MPLRDSLAQGSCDSQFVALRSDAAGFRLLCCALCRCLSLNRCLSRYPSHCLSRYPSLNHYLILIQSQYLNHCLILILSQYLYPCRKDYCLNVRRPDVLLDRAALARANR
jgi:hypothetical protein